MAKDEVTFFEPKKQWDLVAFENQKVLVYAIDHGNDPAMTRDAVYRIMKKTIKKGSDWGGDFVTCITIGKTLWSENGAKVPFSSSDMVLNDDYDYFCKCKYFGGWIWSNYERLILLLTDPNDIAYYEKLQQQQQQVSSKDVSNVE